MEVFVAGLVIVAVAFIVVAINDMGGGDSSNRNSRAPRILTPAEKRRLLGRDEDMPSELALYKWLKENYGDNKNVRIYKRLYLPNPNREQNNGKVLHFFNVDLALLSRQGILAFEVKEGTPQIVMYYKGQFVQVSRKQEGSEFVSYIKSPLEQNKRHIEKLSKLLNKYNVFSVPIEGLITHYLTAKTFVCVDRSQITRDNDYVFLPSELSDGVITAKDTTILKYKLDAFFRKPKVIEKDKFDWLDKFLTFYADAPIAVQLRHIQELKAVFREDYNPHH